MNENLLKRKMLEELFERAEKNTYLMDIHGVDKNQIKELLNILFRLLHAECKKDKELDEELNNSAGIFSAMEKRYLRHFDNDGDYKHHLEGYNKSVEPILKKIYFFINYEYKDKGEFYRHLKVMLRGYAFREEGWKNF